MFANERTMRMASGLHLYLLHLLALRIVTRCPQTPRAAASTSSSMHSLTQGSTTLAVPVYHSLLRWFPRHPGDSKSCSLLQRFKTPKSIVSGKRSGGDDYGDDDFMPTKKAGPWQSAEHTDSTSHSNPTHSPPSRRDPPSSSHPMLSQSPCLTTMVTPSCNPPSQNKRHDPRSYSP
jgi:hypothetical protein